MEKPKTKTNQQKFDFNNLVILDLANNHQGSVEHGLRVIREMGSVIARNGARAGMKFQFRQLDTFIHPDHVNSETNKHIPRFLSTRFEPNQYRELLEEVRRQNMLAICTPFDEESVGLIEEMGFDILKIASCSARDWPLIERAAKSGLPIVCSTGGLTIDDIDNLVSFFNHHGCRYALMHCVSIYPTMAEDCQLNQISHLKSRFPNCVIGWSTHEDPDDTSAVLVAYAQGARMFERHVGVETEDIQLNAYSSRPDQIDVWLEAMTKAKSLCGAPQRPLASENELEGLRSLQRGVFAKNKIEKGGQLSRKDVFFAFPLQVDQIESGKWKEGGEALEEIPAGAPIFAGEVKFPKDPDYLIIKKAVHEVKAILNQAKVVLNSDFEVEYSHHYGIKNFRDTGAILINCFNRSYCKKLIVQLPGQKHPSHYHKLKEETFQVISGELHTEIDGHYRHLSPGDTALIMPGIFHSFWTDTGVIFEEVSTQDHNGDSFYADPVINDVARNQRKTVVDHWGRFHGVLY